MQKLSCRIPLFKQNDAWYTADKLDMSPSLLATPVFHITCISLPQHCVRINLSTHDEEQICVTIFISKSTENLSWENKTVQTRNIERKTT